MPVRLPDRGGTVTISNRPLSEIVRRIEQLRRELDSGVNAERGAALQNEISHLMKVAGAKPSDFEFGIGQRHALTTQPVAESENREESNRPPVPAGFAIDHDSLEGKSYREPSAHETYLMGLLGFDSLQKMEEWMNRPLRDSDVDDVDDETWLEDWLAENADDAAEADEEESHLAKAGCESPDEPRLRG